MRFEIFDLRRKAAKIGFPLLIHRKLFCKMLKTSSRMVAKRKNSSKGNNTKENDKVALAHGLFQICDSLQIICDVQREAIEKLGKIDAPGVKTRITEFSQVLKSIEIELAHTDRMLLKTGMKSVLKRTKETNQAQENQKLRIQNAINASKGLPSIDIRSNFERMKRKMIYPNLEINLISLMDAGISSLRIAIKCQ